MIIGLVGRARSGKDTVARILGLPIVKLAKPVKDAVSILYGWSDEHIEGRLKDEVVPRFHMSPRDSMIHLTRVMKEKHGGDFFSSSFLGKWDGTPVVISDVRYMEDVETLKKATSVVLVRVVRPNCSAIPDEARIESIPVDYVIHNEGSLSDLSDITKRVKSDIVHTLLERAKKVPVVGR